jgi:hypothetical protein
MIKVAVVKVSLLRPESGYRCPLFVAPGRARPWHAASEAVGEAALVQVGIDTIQVRPDRGMPFCSKAPLLTSKQIEVLHIQLSRVLLLMSIAYESNLHWTKSSNGSHRVEFRHNSKRT